MGVSFALITMSLLTFSSSSKIVLVAVSLIPLALANGYEEHGYGGGDHYDKGHEAHVGLKAIALNSIT